MDPLMISFNEKAYQKEIDNLDFSRKKITSFVKMFNSMNLGDLQPDELEDMILSTEDLIKRKTAQSNRSLFAGFDKNKVYDLMEKPLEYDLLVTEIKAFTSVREKRLKDEETLNDYFSHFTIRNGDVIIDEQMLEDIKSEHQVFITTDKARAAYKVATAIVDLLQHEDAKCLAIRDKKDLVGFVDRAIQFELGEPKVYTSFIKTIDAHQKPSPFTYQPPVYSSGTKDDEAP